MHPLSAHLRYRTGVVTAGLVLASVASLLFAGATGSVSIPLADLPGALQELVNGRTDTLAEAVRIGDEVETLYTNGPAGGGGAFKSARDIVAVASVLLPRDLVAPQVRFVDA